MNVRYLRDDDETVAAALAQAAVAARHRDRPGEGDLRPDINDDDLQELYARAHDARLGDAA